MLCTEVTGAGPRRLGPGDSKSPPAADGIASFGQCPGPGTDWQPASDSESEPASGTVTELVLALRLSDHDPAGGPTRRAPSDDDHLTMTSLHGPQKEPAPCHCIMLLVCSTISVYYY